MNRLWSRVGVRVTSVGLLVAGATGGIYLGQDREVQQQSSEASAVAQVAVDDSQLLKQRQTEHAAARAFQRQAEGNAAEKAATAAKAAAGKAHAAEQKVIADKKKAAEEAAAKKKAEEAAAKDSGSGSGSGSSGGYTGDIPASCAEYSGTRETGCAMMLDAGFGISQFPCLEKLWKKESGWNPKATNRSSGAYGIPQALPGSKMASAGSDWKTNAATQIKWGLGYIEGRYDTPCGAWGHSQDVGWY
ncbi:lytic transglycosylase domain-containing protein [Actinoplanes bogorensis]|uniref:Lytic transglycosylase domain-containing protein n=1 Tax=Paractinoplanes bogorensis TaxID=1610840 RepID=A0ABS5YHK4_9ACTN|nr:lytic transglycosylase domain-containing protein [Actinoplanes bogorensis]MBU2662882.1 lytic transglycosylase domain-containing protein [Actinoplanes bogorensis]